MPGPLAGVALVTGAYLVGAIPWGYLAGRLTRGVDLRAVGSGGTGATNVLRTLGARAAAIVFVLDALKGALPVVLARALGFEAVWMAAAGVAAVAGHCWSPYIGFKGGKGVATAAGAAVALFPQALLALPVMAVVVGATRYMSLGSLVGAGIAAALAVLFAGSGRLGWSSALAIVTMAAIIFVRHGGNIERLRKGTERRVGERIPA